ncbi:MAG: hypothetical protein RI906_1912 [Pseudomonadota bacterium]
MASGGALALACGWGVWRGAKISDFRLPASGSDVALSAWLRISPDGSVTVASPHQEMGQGIHTTVALLVAEELECSPSQLRVIEAPIHEAYANPRIVLEGLPLNGSESTAGFVERGTVWTLERILRLMGVQATGGSTSTRNVFQAARQAGASARDMLIRAAAYRLQVEPDRLRVSAGRVFDNGSQRSFSFGELVADAAALSPRLVVLKTAERFQLIGKGLPRLDSQIKSDGRALFGMDVRPPNLAYAAIRHAPTLGGRLLSARPPVAIPRGYLALVAAENFYAVVADSWWRAHKALDLIEARWDAGPLADFDSASGWQAMSAALDAGRDKVLEQEGDPAPRLRSGARILEAEYRVPYLAHLTMEPMNCTVRLDSGRCTVWVGSQSPWLVRRAAAEVAGLSTDSVDVITPFLGGGFGRRTEMDVIREAVQIAKALPGRPVQTIWSRDEDTRNDFYRPAGLARARASLSAGGELSAIEFRLVGASLGQQFMSRLMPSLPKSFVVDKSCGEGAVGLAYSIVHRHISHAIVDPGVPVGYWRSVGYSVNGFYVESFIDECAVAMNVDPYQFRRRLLQSSPRHLRVLDEAARASGWGRPLAANRGERTGRGIALVESFGSVVAIVLELSVTSNEEIRVGRVVAAVDCGMVIDPPNVRAQIVSGVIFGLAAALEGRIDIKQGRVIQGNFSAMPLPLMVSAPRVQVEILASSAPPAGVGEVATPPVAPALANAFFAATRVRRRDLPLRPAQVL